MGVVHGPIKYKQFNSFICYIYLFEASTTSPVQSGHGSNANKNYSILHRFQEMEYPSLTQFSVIPHHHPHVALVARISLTLSRHSSLSFIALSRSSGQHPVSSHSCGMYVHAGRLAFARPCVGVHKSTSLMSSSLLLQQCPACLVRPPASYHENHSSAIPSRPIFGVRASYPQQGIQSAYSKPRWQRDFGEECPGPDITLI